jgi:hypothetical protein
MVTLIQFEQINQLYATVSQVYYLTFRVWLNMFRAPLHPSSGAYNCINSLWFYRRSVGGSSLIGRGLAGPITNNTTATTTFRR